MVRQNSWAIKRENSNRDYQYLIMVDSASFILEDLSKNPPNLLAKYLTSTQIWEHNDVMIRFASSYLNTISLQLLGIMEYPI